MTSILTNNSAMVALQSLRSINNSLTEVSSQISTGKKVASSVDNASLWAVSTVMQSDIDGFNAISESLSLGKATVSVARNASEKVTELLQEMKEKIVAAQGENIDRSKIQTDIDELRNQINGIVGSAQFNGLNLLNGSGTDDINVLASLDRSSNGVAVSNIAVQRQDLTSNVGTYAGTGEGLVTIDNDTLGNAVANVGTTADNTVVLDLALAATTANQTFNLQIGNFSYSATFDTNGTDTSATAAANIQAAITNAGIEGLTATVQNTDELVITNASAFTDQTITFSAAGGATYEGQTNANGANSGALSGTPAATASADFTASKTAETVTLAAGKPVEGAGYQVTIGTQVFSYIAGKNESMNDVVNGLKAVIDSTATDTAISTQAIASSDPASTGPQLMINYDGTDVALAVDSGLGGTATGGLIGLNGIDVTTSVGATRALDTVETLIQSSVDASAAFGSSEKRIDIQTDFVTSLVDSLTSGIGALVDANMEKASAKLQALQVQQQLGTQSLAIANSGPQNILSLFR